MARLDEVFISWETSKVEEKIVVTLKYHIKTFLYVLIISQNMYLFNFLVIFNIYAPIAYGLNFL